jgi:hypothetical protein
VRAGAVGCTGLLRRTCRRIARGSSGRDPRRDL